MPPRTQRRTFADMTDEETAPLIHRPRSQSATSLRIAGLTPMSTVDWPGKLAATVFLQGCSWDCFFCSNTELQDPRVSGEIAWRDVLDFARKRRGLLDAFVFSGGEPTMQRGLLEAIVATRALGFKIGLHTCGSFPTLLKRVLPYVDWVGIDVKALKPEYVAVTGREKSDAAAWRSLGFVLEEATRREDEPGSRPFTYEVRTTVHPGVMTAEYLAELADHVAQAGAKTYAVQDFRPDGVRDPMPRRGFLHDSDYDASGSADVSLIDPTKFDRFIHRVQ